MQTLTKNILRHKYKIVAVIYTLWLTAISLSPLNGVDLPSFKFADKIVHFFLYFFLTLVWLKAYPAFTRKIILLLAGVVLWGIAIEFIQENFIPNRSGDVFDALANTLGGITALFIFKKFL